MTQVSIGDRITCSCGIVQNDHCIHTLYVLLKKFKVPPTNPIIWQGNHHLMQPPIWIQSSKALSSSNSQKRKKNKGKNISSKSLGILPRLPKRLMIFHHFKKTQCAPSVMRRWTDNATLHVKLAKKACILNVSRSGPNTKKIQMYPLLVLCAVLSSKTRWWSSLRIFRNGKHGSRLIKVLCVKDVVWKISKESYINAFYAVVVSYASCVFREISIPNIRGLSWSNWLTKVGNGHQSE